MPTFTFTGFDSLGKRLGGAVSRPTEAAAREYLAGKKYIVSGVYASRTAYSAGVYTRVSPKELSIFCREVSVLFFSQITLMEGLLMLAEQAENKQLKAALAEVRERMDEGVTFADAMAMYPHIFTAYLIGMIAIGETSGSLDTVFAKMSDYFDKEARIRKKLRSAVAYPLALCVLMAAIVLMLIVKILPMFQDTLASMGGEPPAATKIIFSVSNFITNYVWIIIAAIVVIAAAFWALTRAGAGRKWLDKAKLTWPISRFIQTRILTSRFSRALAILLKSGVQMLNAMENVLTLAGNGYADEKFAAAVKQVKEGKDLSDVFREIGIFPPMFIKLVSVGSATGRLDEMLERSANVFEEEADDAIERLTVMIEPALIIALSVIVGVILLSVMLPMISIMNAII